MEPAYSADEPSAEHAEARAARELASLLEPEETDPARGFDRVERELRRIFAEHAETLEIVLEAVAELRQVPGAQLLGELTRFEALLEAFVSRHDSWGDGA